MEPVGRCRICVHWRRGGFARCTVGLCKCRRAAGSAISSLALRIECRAALLPSYSFTDSPDQAASVDLAPMASRRAERRMTSAAHSWGRPLVCRRIESPATVGSQGNHKTNQKSGYCASRNNWDDSSDTSICCPFPFPRVRGVRTPVVTKRPATRVASTEKTINFSRPSRRSNAGCESERRQ